MGMARITIYRKSVLATVVSIFGYFLLAMGVMGLMEKEYVMGVVCIAAAFGVHLWASVINDNKLFKLWKKDLEAKGLIPEIAMHQSVAIKCYNACPGNKALAYIRTLNPAAADEIARQLAAQKAQQEKK